MQDRHRLYTYLYVAITKASHHTTAANLLALTDQVLQHAVEPVYTGHCICRSHLSKTARWRGPARTSLIRQVPGSHKWSVWLDRFRGIYTDLPNSLACTYCSCIHVHALCRNSFSFGSIVQKGKFSAEAALFVSTLKKVDFLKEDKRWRTHKHTLHLHSSTTVRASINLSEWTMLMCASIRSLSYQSALRNI